MRHAPGFRERTTGTDPGDQTGGPGARDAPKFPLRRNRGAGQGDLREKRKGQKVLAKERERGRGAVLGGKGPVRDGLGTQKKDRDGPEKGTISRWTTEETPRESHPHRRKKSKKRKKERTTGRAYKTLQGTTRTTGTGAVGTGVIGTPGNPTTTLRERVRKVQEKEKEKRSQRARTRRAKGNQRLPRGERNQSSKELHK